GYDFSTIQAAINDSNNGDTVIVYPGGYYEHIDFVGKAITVSSSNPDDPSIAAATVIDAGGSGSAVTFANGEGADAVLSGFTITGGYGTVNAWFGDSICWGGGVYCFGASPTIVGNVIANNHGPAGTGDFAGYGGGIGCLESGATIERNIIRDNSAFLGAGITAWLGSDRISSNLIYDNSASFGGGAFLLYGSRLSNNTLVGNTGLEYGGNIYAASYDESSLCWVVSNIISDAPAGGGIYYEGSWLLSGSLTYNNVWNNSPGDYIYCPDRTGINGNISQDPLFVSLSGADYHLLADSPCINAGDPDFVPEAEETDMDGQPRVYAVWVDIGADEYVGYIKPVANAGPDQYLDEIQIVTLDGRGSFFHDPNGTRLFEWTQIAGPAVTLSDPCAAQPSFTPVLEAEYSFELVVGDGLNFSSPDTVLIVAGNRPPVAVAGPNSFGQVGREVYLDGSGSYDPDPGDELTYFWTQVGGPAVVLSDPCAAQPSFVPALEAEYSFELVVGDGLDYSLPDTVVIVVCNRAPVAVAGPNSFGQVGRRIYLDASGSYDPDPGDELTCFWTQVDGPNVVLYDSNTATPYFNPAEEGQYTFELVVSDGALTSVPDAVTVDVLRSGLLLYYSFDGSLGVDLPDVITDDSGNNFEFTKYSRGAGTVTYGESSPVVSASTASADFFPNAGLYRLDPCPPEVVDPLRLAGDEYTVELWMKPERLSSSMDERVALIGYRSIDTQWCPSWRIGINYPGGQRELRFFHDGQDEGASRLVNVGEWYHVAGVYDRNAGEQHRMELFLDGEVIEDASTISRNPQYITEPIGIGCDALPDGTFDKFFDGLIDEVRIYNMALPPCQFQLTPADEYACCPNPEDGARFADPCDLFVSWRAAEAAQWHDVYFGADYDDVADANTSSSLYRGRQALFDTFYFPPEPLEQDQTYYWRIDEVNGPNILKGEVWSFTTARNIVVYDNWSRFPAKNGLLWTWGDDEAVVGFELGGQESVLSRSTDGGMTWTMFDPPNYAGDGDAPVPSPGGIDFAHPDFAMRVVGDVFWVSYDRCASWEGPYEMGNFGQPDADSWQRTSHTDYVVKGPGECLVFMSARPDVYDTDRVFCVRTVDGGATFQFRGWIVPPGDPNAAAMSSTVGSACLLSSAVQRVDPYTGEGSIDLFVSFNDGATWSFRSRIGQTGKSGGDPPALVRLQDGRLCCVYGHRNDVRMYLRYSVDEGLSWDEQIIMRDDWGAHGDHELGYPRIAQLANGDVVCAYYWSTLARRDNHIAATIWGELSVDGEVENLTTGERYDLIQNAICRASDGDEIVVYPGNYYENINFYGKDLKVRSANPTDSSVVAATVIHGWGRGPAVAFERGEKSSTVLAGLTITDGNEGIYCNGGCPTVKYCNIVGNAGAGIKWLTSLVCRWPVVANCTIVGNGGDGIDFQERGNPSVVNCVISGNLGNGIHARSPWITNCTVVDNGLSGLWSLGGTVSNCVIRDNGDFEIQGSPIVRHSNIQGGWAGVGNMDADPCFVQPGYWDSNGAWTGGNYHLAVGSPCVDAGDNGCLPADKADLDGDANTAECIPWDLGCNLRMVDGDNDGNCVVDIGAYEFFLPPIEVAMKFTPSSLNPASQGNWIKLHFVLPQGYGVEDVDVNEP
ncbi:MAG: PKD domain-containing protein, partial [Planctomycetota bacterium]